MFQVEGHQEERDEEREEIARWEEQVTKEKAFILAVQLRDVGTVQSMLYKGIDPMKFEFEHGQSALNYAFESGDEEMINLLFDHCGVVELDDFEFCRDSTGYKEWWRDPDTGKWAKTARLRLHKAIEKNKINEIKDELDVDGTMLEEKDEDWRTPLSLAIQMGNREAVKILLLHGADLHADGSILHASRHVTSFRYPEQA